MQEISSFSEHHGILTPYGVNPQLCRCFLYEAGEVLLHQGEESQFLFFLIRGVARVQVSHEDGRFLSLSYSVSEGVLGDVELMRRHDTATTTVIAETNLLCLALPFRTAKQEREHNLRFVRRVAEDLAAKLSRSTDSFLRASLSRGESRACRYLLREQQSGVYRGTLAAMAAATGLSYRQAQRVMKTLCAEAVLRKGADGYRILNAAGLERRARL